VSTIIQHSLFLVYFFSIHPEENDIRIVIRDNGKGAPQKKLEELNESFKTNRDIKRGRHIGLSNVNHRLNIIYGENVFMQVYNDEEGFVVEIVHPFEV